VKKTTTKKRKRTTPPRVIVGVYQGTAEATYIVPGTGTPVVHIIDWDAISSGDLPTDTPRWVLALLDEYDRRKLRGEEEVE
jgi:hypothetical protein